MKQPVDIFRPSRSIDETCCGAQSRSAHMHTRIVRTYESWSGPSQHGRHVGERSERISEMGT